MQYWKKFPFLLPFSSTNISRNGFNIICLLLKGNYQLSCFRSRCHKLTYSEECSKLKAVASSGKSLKPVLIWAVTSHLKLLWHACCHSSPCLVFPFMLWNSHMNTFHLLMSLAIDLQPLRSRISLELLIAIAKQIQLLLPLPCGLNFHKFNRAKFLF